MMIPAQHSPHQKVLEIQELIGFRVLRPNI